MHWLKSTSPSWHLKIVILAPCCSDCCASHHHKFCPDGREIVPHNPIVSVGMLKFWETQTEYQISNCCNGQIQQGTRCLILYHFPSYKFFLQFLDLLNELQELKSPKVTELLYQYLNTLGLANHSVLQLYSSVFSSIGDQIFSPGKHCTPSHIQFDQELQVVGSIWA